MKKLFFLIILSSLSFIIKGQELDCRIQINSSQIQGTALDRTFQSLQQALYEFVNNTQWTNNVFARDERIECNIQIIVESQVSSDEFKGSIQITFSRPVYGTSYLSPILNHKDNDFTFKYNESEQLEFNPNTYTSNLISVIAYYCYLVIGMDYDTFSQFAGTQYFQNAERIVQNAQVAQESGWKAFENLKNRYWITENLLSDQYSQLRDFFYTYHRLGMDKLAEKPVEARAAIEQALEGLRAVHRRKPGSILMTMILTVKADEIINIFSDAFSDEKARVTNILKEIDASNASKYDKIMKESN